MFSCFYQILLIGNKSKIFRILKLYSRFVVTHCLFKKIIALSVLYIKSCNISILNSTVIIYQPNQSQPTFLVTLQKSPPDNLREILSFLIVIFFLQEYI